MGREGVKQEIIGDLAAEALFGESSELYLRLYGEGLIDSSFGGGFEAVDGCAMLTCGGDSEDAQAVRDAISPTVSSEAASSGEIITEDQAKAIALEHAGLAEADISRLQVRKDFDDGRQEYEVEFHVDRMEYEYEIDAVTGKILSFDKDL